MGSWNAYVFMGRERGFFAKEQLELVPVYMSISSARAALIAGEVHGIEYNPATPHRRGQEVAIFSLNKRAGWFLFAKPSIADPKSLQGKSVAVGSVGTTAYQITQWILERKGADPKHVTFVGGRGGSALRLQMLLGGAVDGAVLNAPYNRIALQKGFNLIADMTDIDLIQNGLVVNRDVLKNRTALYKKVLHAMVRSHLYTMTHRQETASWLIKNSGISREDADTVVETMVKTSTTYGLPPQAALNNFVRFSGVSKDEVGEFYDYTLLREVLQEMGIKPEN
jgi:ABC-type nitrate/sulfonate/bicarbonate transport system substrate-binding protein